MTAQATFDPVVFKQTTRRQWQEAADAWHRWGVVIGRWLDAATEAMVGDAGIGEGSRVLDVAAGAGEQTLRIARRVGPTGHVLATDLAPDLLARAAADASAAGLANVATRELDGEDTGTLDAGSFDAVVSRVGLIYFPDRHRALTGVHRVLRPGGRVSVVTYSTPDRNGFFAVPVGIIRARAGLPAPVPGQPGPFSLGAPGVLEDALAAAGFTDVAVRAVPSPLELASAAECVRFQQESFGALHQMLAGLDPAAREDVWAEVEDALRRFEGPGGFVGPCEMLVGSGTRR
jgi:SAM-dependent methyltransferase